MEGNRNSIGGIANPFAQRSGLQIPTSAYCLSANARGGTSKPAGTNACEPEEITTPGGWAGMVSDGTGKILELREKRDSISGLIDGGETAELLDAIADEELDPDTLEALLNGHFPLSDEVLEAYIGILDRTPYANFRAVIMPNEPMSENTYVLLLIAIEEMSNEVVFELKYGQGHSDSLTLTQLDQKIQDEGLERQLAFNNVITYYLDADSTDNAIAYLEADSLEPWCAASKQTLFATYLAIDSLEKAAELLTAFEPADEEQEGWKELSEMMLELATDSLTVFDMDSVQEDLVRDIAYGELSSLAQTNAQSILYLVYGEGFELNLEEPSGKTDETLNENNTEEGITAADENYFKFYPNPAHAELYCAYKIKETDVAYVVLFNLLGEKISEKQIQPGANTTNISLANCRQGVYLYKVIVNNSVAQTGKIAVINK